MAPTHNLKIGSCGYILLSRNKDICAICCDQCDHVFNDLDEFKAHIDGPHADEFNYENIEVEENYTFEEKLENDNEVANVEANDELNVVNIDDRNVLVNVGNDEQSVVSEETYTILLNDIETDENDTQVDQAAAQKNDNTEASKAEGALKVINKFSVNKRKNNAQFNVPTSSKKVKSQRNTEAVQQNVAENNGNAVKKPKILNGSFGSTLKKSEEFDNNVFEVIFVDQHVGNKSMIQRKAQTATNNLLAKASQADIYDIAKKSNTEATFSGNALAKGNTLQQMQPAGRKVLKSVENQVEVQMPQPIGNMQVLQEFSTPIKQVLPAATVPDLNKTFSFNANTSSTNTTTKQTQTMNAPFAPITAIELPNEVALVDWSLFESGLNVRKPMPIGTPNFQLPQQAAVAAANASNSSKLWALLNSATYNPTTTQVQNNPFASIQQQTFMRAMSTPLSKNASEISPSANAMANPMLANCSLNSSFNTTTQSALLDVSSCEVLKDAVLEIAQENPKLKKHLTYLKIFGLLFIKYPLYAGKISLQCADIDMANAEKFSNILKIYPFIWKPVICEAKKIGNVIANFKSLANDIKREFSVEIDIPDMKRVTNALILWYNQNITNTLFNKKPMSMFEQKCLNVFKFIPKSGNRLYFCEFCPSQARTAEQYYAHEADHKDYEEASKSDIKILNL